MAFQLTSYAFEDGAPIPTRYSQDGENISPPLEWSNAPKETAEFAILCEDPDAPLPHPFVHWIVYGLSANVSKLPEGIPHSSELSIPALARQGVNSTLGVGYTGPNPPRWHGPHRYYFRLFALSQPIGLRPRADRGEFLRLIEPYVLAETTLLGTYGKSRGERIKTPLRWAMIAGAIGLVVASFPRLRAAVSSTAPRRSAA